ncbi:DsbA family protein [Pilimelia columellifera]|uniref:Thioredoxin domain-containing protein n=1 Tax=Pilimelia columellifera subsp. columellifera TaxID=706583 RepID=A0ABP6AU35_9ACTN
MSKRPAPKAPPSYLVAEKRRQRTVWTSIVTLAVLLIAGIVGYATYATQRADDITYPKATAPGDNTGFALGAGPVKVDVYTDFMCPGCKNFKDASWPALETMIRENKITVVYHPVAILDHSSQGSKFSTRAAAISACAADSGKFNEFNAAMYAQQPAQGTAGLTNEQMIDMGRGVGLGDDFVKCAEDKKYGNWVREITNTMSERGFRLTPTVTVNGKQLETPSPEKITEAVTAATK